MRNVFLTLIGVVLAIVVATATSRSEGETEAPTDPAEPIPEPTTGTPVDPLPGSETEMKDPHALFEIGGPEAAWPLSSLTTEERAVVDHGLNQPGWDATNDAYANAARQRSAQAKAEAAASQLGIDPVLDTQGVVP